jgi:hypothetical protein
MTIDEKLIQKDFKMIFETMSVRCDSCLTHKVEPFNIFVYPKGIQTRLCMKCYNALEQIIWSTLLNSEEKRKRVAEFFDFVK